MTCESCPHLIIREMSYEELFILWNELYATPINYGYRNKYIRRARKYKTDIEDVRISFRYCDEGRLGRIYVDNDKDGNTPLCPIQPCPLYTGELPDSELKEVDADVYYGRDFTLEEIGRMLGVTRERVRQIEAKAIRKLQHASRRRKLESFAR